ncbi:RNA polymerase sporulation-specific sigma factor [Caldicoprobacter guelmensis]|uniref:RNA polymerase sigma factor n=1 Tax=Caldicoprobacter guelmensis TaxID=1170224 RepID=UPI00195BFE3E|nr:sigma-70 family RNA polymerase sigma factor [Caldicoprobacter guelmensis]MBM7582614.1 RNA polymerase sporulation-specific sigma factor [Caldicoprobacter guelmensis]
MEYLFKELVEKAKSNERAAIQEVINRLRPLVCSAIRRCGAGHEWEDLYQEACLVVLECLRDFDPSRGVPFLVYVKKRMYFSLMNAARQRVSAISLDKEIEGHDGDTCTLSDLIVDPQGNVEEAVEKSGEIRRLYSAIGKLSPKQKGIILMHFFYGLKYKDIARLRNSHYKSVLRLKDRALKSLREHLDKV